MSLLRSQTHIFTDGEDEELKKKIGKIYQGNFVVGTERHIVKLQRYMFMMRQVVL